MKPPMKDALNEALPPAHARAPEPGDAAALVRALSQDGIAPPPQLGERLMARVRAHAQANATLHTRRHPLREPAQTLPGCRAWPLAAHSRLVELDAGALLPDDGHSSRELLLLSGSLLGPQGERLQAQDYALAAPGSMLRAEQRSRLYLRAHGADGPFHSSAPLHLMRSRQADAGWQPLREGVSLLPLYAEGEALSLLARFEAGARVPAHPHGIDEECLMVEGELFLGDVLLPEGGFQLAPGGTQHGELFADAPCLLFFHGAIDPQAVDNAFRLQRGYPAL